jgi:signal transduction histidine kinase/CheY-like chemotaxis protein/HPt (histidine-containing phosphotransfer) domain-containing protein
MVVWPVPASCLQQRQADGLDHVRTIAETLDSLHVGLCLFDDEDRTLLWNRSFLRLFPEHDGHVAVGEAYAENLRRFYANRVRPGDDGVMQQCISEGIARHRGQTQPFIFEHRGQWVRVASQPMPGLGRIRIWTPIAAPDGTAEPDGPIREVLPFPAEDGDGSAVMEADGRIASCNARFVHFFGLAGPEAAAGLTLAEAFATAWEEAPEGAALARPWLQTLAEGECFTGAPFELPLPAGRWLRVLQQRRIDGRLVSSFADISAMKALQRELAAAREAAEAANRAKDGFLATISHELRTPMHGILGMLDLLEEGGLRPGQAERLGLARHSAEALLGLLDDILAFSRLGAGHLALDMVEASPAGLLESVGRLMQPRAVQKGLALGWTVDEAVPAAVMTDPARLRQVLLNLVGNAVKFTGRGRIRLAVRAGAPRPDGRVPLEFEVADTGLGIPAAALRRIFEPFVQADDGIARRFGGTGLGLAICRQIVGAMDGEIAVESREGVGSRFRVTIACAPTAAPTAAPGPASARPAAPAAAAGPALPPLRVLVVDDHPTNRLVAQLQLERLGLQATCAADAAEALAACASPFDLVLMDLEMPGMDGLALAGAIRASGLPAAAAPMIALTAHVGEGHRARCLAAGMQGFVTKPMRMAVLAEAIAAAIGLPAPHSEAPPRAPAPPPQNLLDAERAGLHAQHLPGETWRRIVEEFGQQAREALAVLRDGAEPEAHRLAAHQIKGAAWNLGAQRLGDVAASLEGQAGTELRSRLPDLEAVLEASLAALTRLARS